jgi:LacI family transcriptional regulator
VTDASAEVTRPGGSPVAGRRSTIADVAARAGVDRALVSRILNEDPSVRARPETRQRVRDAVAELQYRPHRAARNLRMARANAVGLVIPSFDNPIWAVVLDGIQEEADNRGLALIVGSSRPGQGRLAKFVEFGATGALDGILVATAGDEALPDRSPVPWLLLNRRTPTSRRHVLVDDEAAAHLATSHLLDLGHRRIGMIGGPARVDSAIRRRQGFDRALGEHQIIPSAVLDAEYTHASGRHAAFTLMTEAPDTTGIVVANIASASGALIGIREAGFSVPDRVSVITIHDHPLAEAFSPPLTTVSLPLHELGRRALEILMDTPPDQPVDELITGGLTLIVRASTAPPPPAI